MRLNYTSLSCSEVLSVLLSCLKLNFNSVLWSFNFYTYLAPVSSPTIVIRCFTPWSLCSSHIGLHSSLRRNQVGLFLRTFPQAVVRPEPFFSYIPTVQNTFLLVNIVEEGKIRKSTILKYYSIFIKRTYLCNHNLHSITNTTEASSCLLSIITPQK